MQKHLLLLPFLFFLHPFFLLADTHTGCDADAIAKGASTVRLNEENKSIKYIKLEEPLALAPDQMDEWLKTTLNANAKTNFREHQVRADKTGLVNYRFQQTYEGIAVNQGVFYIHTRDGKIVSANGEFYPNITITTVPLITAASAIGIGKSHIHGHQWAWEDGKFPVPALTIAATKTGYHLTYKTDIYSLEPLDRKWLMIDAITGKVIAEYNRIHINSVEGEAHCKYHGVQTIVVDSLAPNSYRLRDDTRGGGVETYDMNEGDDYTTAVDFTDSDNIWDSTINDDDAALDAHWGTEGMYDYMLNIHNWESYDGQGAPMLSYVHYGSDFYNAFWDGERMTYGDGDGVTATALTSTEVVGHEIFHGVTEHTAALIYSDESGGLNESYSDCFGVILDYQLNPATANYLIGDDFSVTGTPFRNMGNPNEYGNPDTYGGLYWDFNEVHNWSGVQNFWFYLVTQGGSGTNDIGDNYFVAPMPMADVADILFLSLSTYLTPNSTYADARFYSIIVAEDLFGPCSNQVINVTNAWYAVGVGGVFTGAAIAGFYSNATFNCEAPVSVQFTNTSFNCTAFEWDFGNGTTSTDENPMAEYTTPGTYTVSLISSGSGLLCNDIDTLILVDYITVSDLGSPVTPSCMPTTDDPISTQGIFNFNFESINNLTAGGVDSYQDYSCTKVTNVQEGVLYSFLVKTGEEENIRIWIDVDGDGVFNNTNELVYESPDPAVDHFGSFLVPDTELYNSPIRLRIKSDVSTADISTPCNTVVSGQVEDYGLFISENIQAPAVDFVANTTAVLPGSTVVFTDLTQNLPANWSWVFEGGEPATATEQHPSVTYNTLGLYPVSLVATNANGVDTEIKTEYILVANIATMCNIAYAGSQNGLFTDSGGATGDYTDNESCEFLIDPGCSIELYVTFTSFNTESGYDYLYAYDGADDTAPLIGIYNGNDSPGTLTASSGKMFFYFYSDFSVTAPGWEANWTSLTPLAAPVADFSISDNNTPANVPVAFTDLSTQYPSEWLWDFGNGITSTDQNPTSAYDTPGTYTVQLISGNCFDYDTTSQLITVQELASIIVDPTSIEITITCEDSIVVPVTITNTGLGDLVFSFDGAGAGNADLDSVRARLNLQYSSLTDLMPNYFEFDEGEFGIGINDGGNDMYDGGNYISTNSNAPLLYSNNLVIPNSDLGPDGQYFTSKQPGLFVFAGDINGLNTFNIDGDLGADGGGNLNSTILAVSLNGKNYKGFVKRVYNAGDPSVNHLIIVEDNGMQTQTFSTNTNSDLHTIEGLNGTTRIYYLLFAEANGGLYSDATMEAVMTQFLDIIGSGGIVQVPTGSHTLGSNDSQTFDFVFYNGLENGTYNSVVTVYSNTPGLGTTEIGIIFHVNNEICTEFEYSFLNECNAQVQFTDLSISNPSSWSWDFGDGSAGSTAQNPTHTYESNGTYDVVLTTVNSFGTATHNQTVTISNIINATILPVSPTQVNVPVTFAANAPGAITYDWDFGDGNTSTDAMPTYTYTAMGNYIVTLTATNAAGCSATTTTLVSILVSGLTELEGLILLYPNPASDALYIANSSGKNYTEIEVVNVIGQVVKRVATADFSGTVYQLNLDNLVAGVYIVGIRFGEEGMWRSKVVLE